MAPRPRPRGWQPPARHRGAFERPLNVTLPAQRPDQVTKADTFAADRGETREQYEAAVTEQLRELTANPISLRMNEQGLAALISNGRVQNIFDTGEIRDTGEDDKYAPSYLNDRRRIERKMFGIPDDAPGTARPAYGYFDSPLTDGEALSYGDVVLHLRDEVRPRTTFTVSDSFRSNAVPSYADDPSPYSAIGTSPAGAAIPEDLANIPWNAPEEDHRRRYDPLNWEMNSKRWLDKDYVEAQIHGGVTAADIESITIPDDIDVDEKALADAGIRVQRVPRGAPAGVPSAASDVAGVPPASEPTSVPAAVAGPGGDVPLTTLSDETGQFEPGGWADPDTVTSVQRGLDMVRERYPNAPKLRTIGIRPEQTALGNKSIDTITVSPAFHDPAIWEQKQKDSWLFAGDGTPAATIFHEYGHILDGALTAKQRKRLDAIVRAPITYEVNGQSVTVPRWQSGTSDYPAPSAYASESPYEFVAEALTDVAFNGDQAKPVSKEIEAIFAEVFGG